MLLAGVILALTGCGSYESPKPPDVEWSEDPTDAYVATLNVEGLDMAYTVTAKGYFSIENRQCLPVDKRRSLGGSRHHYLEIRDIPVIKVSSNTYKIVFYAD